MNYKYRVTLAGIKGFYRLYEVDGSNTLYTFHKQLRSDLEFPSDLPILFKALDADGNVVARYAFVDLGQGTVDEVSLNKTIADGAVKFIYFYDTQSKKSVEITLESEDPVSHVMIPTVIESKGPLPIEFEHGYVAFEDLPKQERKIPGSGFSEEDDEDEDEDDDDEEVNEDKEDEELVYEEDEQ